LDVALFYAAPFGAAIASCHYAFTVKVDAYNVSITFFGIFIALLLNIQVAMFGIFQRKWEVPKDQRLAEIQHETLSDRRALLIELNANLSYLILVCVAALFAALVFYIMDWKDGAAPPIMVFLYIHFLLTLSMIVKRSHALFQKEYVSEI